MSSVGLIPTPIAVVDLHKKYRDTYAVAGVTFSVESGQILGLVGPNGAGKTTIIRAACGIHPPTAGQIRVCGHDVTTQQVPAKRQLAYVPDDPKLFSTLTVWEHLRFVAAAYRVQDQLDQVGERLLTEFDLTEKRNTMASALSRGMRQKLAICCAYLHEPRALFLDEPLTGLDPRGMRTMKASIRRHAERGAAVVISSHLLSLVEDMCSHLLILHHGRILYHGTLAGLRESVGKSEAQATLEDIFLHMTEDNTADESNRDSDNA